MKILIQKFGGTSVQNEARRNQAVQKILKAKEDGYSPVVVVSAMGRMGDPYSTDTLLSIVKGKNIVSNKRNLDSLMVCGEIISCNVICASLKGAGVECSVLTGGQAGIITDNNYGEAEVLKVNTERIYKLLQNGIVPVVAGFQGMTEEGEFTTLGRGGSDTSAAILGEALKACEIQIYTDVDGIMTADPKLVPDAQAIDVLGYNEVFQFADMGAKVIHPRAVEYAMRGNIPLVIKNTMSDAPGTLITNTGDSHGRLITGITYMPLRTQIYIEDIPENIDDEYIFTSLAENSISIDLINVFPDYRVFTIDDDCTERASDILKRFNINFRVIRNCCKISVIGERIRGVPGVMARILKALKKGNVKILQTSDSHTTIWCLVNKEDTAQALNCLHNEFNLSDI